MSALQPYLPGATVLDLFAGSGALGIEALSRGAAQVTAVEWSRTALRTLRANLEALGVRDELEIIRTDAVDFIRELEEGAYDLALADPPYRTGIVDEIVEIFLDRRFADSLWVEHGPDEPLPEIPGARTRRYGDTALTSIPAPR